MKKKSLLVVCIAIVIIASIAIAQTIAYFSSTATATNVFTIGDVEIALEEENWVQGSKIVPGKPIDKDPTVTVLEGSEECYVRILLTFNCVSVWNDIFAEVETVNVADYIIGLNSDWILQNANPSVKDDTVTFEFWYKSTVTADAADVELAPLFTALAAPIEMNNDQAAALGAGDFVVTVTAQAIQAESFTDAAAAWAAWN